MLSENPILQYIRLTLLPCLTRLFGKRRRLSSLCLLLTLTVSALLLSMLCLTFGQNLASLDTLTTAFNEYVTAHGVTLGNQPFRESVRSVLTYAEAEVYVTHVCLLGLWLVTSAAATLRVFSESVATEKYVYALYIIYGADTKRLRRSIIREFWVLGLPALLLSFPLGLRLCHDPATVSGFSLLYAAEMLVLFFLLSLLCAHRVTGRLFRESCVQLMTAIDTSEYIESPRRISLRRTLRKKSGFGYALTAFGRMRKYRFTHALSVALIGAVLFSLSALTLPDHYATDASTHEYTLTFENGVSFDALNREYLPAIESLEAVVSTTSHASDTAERLGLHLSLLPRQVSDDHSPSLLQQEDKWALDTVKIACGDGVTGTELGERSVVIPEEFKNRQVEEFGYTLATLRAGEAAYVYPEQDGEPDIQIGDTVEIAIPDGVEGYDRYGNHITVTVSKLVPVGELHTLKTFNDPFIETICPRIFEDYLYLSPEDYGIISGIRQALPISVTETFSEELGLTEDGCYLLLPEKLKNTYADLSHVTVITPKEAVKKAYFSYERTDEKAPELPTDTYFINDTYQYAGIYLGEAEDYAASPDATETMADRMSTILDPEDEDDAPMATEFRVIGRSYTTDLSAPCVVFMQGEEVIFTSMATELSAMTLKASGCTDKALYFMDVEAAVLSVDDDAVYEKGTQLYLTTDLPDDFVTAMAEAEVPLIRPRENYTLTDGNVRATFKGSDGQPYVVFRLSPESDLCHDRYPAVINGVGSYLPVGDATADSILTLSDIDSMLVFYGDPKGERDNAAVLQGDIVTNQFILMTEKEAGLSDTLGENEAILRLPEAHPYALESGDLVHMAIAQPLSLDLLQMDLKGLDLLAYQLERLDHAYLPITWSRIEVAPDLTVPVIIVSEEVFCTLCGREGVVSDLNIYVDSYATLEELSEVSATLHGLTAEDIILDNRNTVLRSHGTGSQRYPSLLRSMIPPLCALIPLLLLSSARTLYLRREKERSGYVAAGDNRRMQIQMALGEGLLSALFSGGLYALLCPLFMLVLKLFCGKFHVPLSPDGFTVSGFVAIFGLILLSACLCALPNLRPRSHNHLPPKHRKKGGLAS